jgi:hypothetical protein
MGWPVRDPYFERASTVHPYLHFRHYNEALELSSCWAASLRDAIMSCTALALKPYNGFTSFY